MRVILNLDEPTLQKLGEMADGEKRSRKNFMELVLETVTEPPPPEPLTKTFITPQSSVTDIKTNEVVVNNTKDVQEIKPEMPDWKKNLLAYQQKQKK